MSGVAKSTTQTSGTAALRSVPHDRALQFRTMFEGAALGIAACTLDGRILETNVAFATMFGYRHAELTGRHVVELRAGDFKREDDALEKLQRGPQDSLTQQSHYLRKDGSDLWAQLTASVVRDVAGEPSFLIALLVNTTEAKRAEEASREAEKMEVIGRLAGGIAHDFNNLLTGVLLYCDLISDGLRKGNLLRQHVQEIRLAGEQGAALTHQLLAISRKQVPQRLPISLNDVVTSTENLLRRLIGEQIELVTRLAPRLRRISADPAELRQVLLNLVLNARDALAQGGRITLRTQAKQRIHGNQPAVSLVVEDTGCGMDEPVRARLFEPFFTTKPPGHGTGLGLATVQRVVSESDGMINVKSELGRGTRIEVLLPALPAPPAAPVRVKTSTVGQTILLVDDHASARNSIQRVLHHAGMRVLPAASGKQALKVFAESASQINLVIADWNMPGMTGRELAARLLQQKPTLKILLISGCPDPREGPPPDSVELIRKPFAGRVLLERIREVLDSKGDAPW